MLWNMLMLASREIRRNILRSGLTILGIVIGVAAVITMVTLGGGATERIKGDIGRLGFNLLIVVPGVERKGGGGLIPGAEPFEMADVEAIREQVSLVNSAAPVSVHPVLAVAGNRNWQTMAQGSDNAFFRTRNWPVKQGRQFTPNELRGGKAVCILGESVRRELYGQRDPIGDKIRLGRLAYEIVGILDAKGQSFTGEDQDDLVVLPLRTVQRRVSGNRNVSMIYVSAESESATPRLKDSLNRLMRERRRIPADAEEDFSVRDLKEISELIEQTTGVLTAFVSAIAAVSLLVGGIGIMNTTLVTVTERTREIGTRLAIGALEREVLLQFLVEAAVLSAFGGSVGIVIGLTSAAGLAAWMEIPYMFDVKIVAAAFVFSALVGVVFGCYPAMQAARLNPIDALRHE